MAALAADPNVGEKSGGLFSSWGLAREYGFTDVDGQQPHWGSFFRSQVRRILEQETPPDDMDRFVVQTRLWQTERDPAAGEEARRLKAWLERHG